MKKHHAYVVKWRDSATATGWKSLEYDGGVATITSIGWLVRESKTAVTISTCISTCGSTREALTIPREAITKMARLKNYIANSG